MLELKITADNANQLMAQIAGLQIGAVAVVPTLPAEVEAPKDEKPARKPRAAKSEKAEAPGELERQPTPSSNETENQSGSNGASLGAADAVDYKEVQKAVTNLAAAKGRQAVVDVLDQFGVDHASKVEEARWGELISALNDANEEA